MAGQILAELQYSTADQPKETRWIVPSRAKQCRPYNRKVPTRLVSGTIATLREASSRQILGVGDVFEPVDDFAVELFLNGDVGHGGSWRGAVPVLFAG